VGERVDAYSIDRADRVASVSDSWLEFARANRAPELTRGHVLGESIWRFIAGTETRRLYEDLFLRVRTRAESVEFPFRCDSPDRFRFMRLSLEPGPRGSILCRGITVREQERPFFSILDRAFPRNASSLSMCSFCKRIYAFDAQWLDAEDAIGQLELFDSATLPRIEYAVCDACSSIRRATSDGAAAV
jgi:hypothetical protein